MCYRGRAVWRHWLKGRPKRPDWRTPRVVAIAGSDGVCRVTTPPCALSVRIWDDPTFLDKGDGRPPHDLQRHASTAARGSPPGACPKTAPAGRSIVLGDRAPKAGLEPAWA